MSSSTEIGKSPRGDDFTHKYKKGEWAESTLCRNLSEKTNLLVIQYGVSRQDSLSTEDELSSIKEPNVDNIKRPDILIFSQKHISNSLSESDLSLLKNFNQGSPDERQSLLLEIEKRDLITHATAAVEAEASRFHKSVRDSKFNSLSAYVKTEDHSRLENWAKRYPTVDLYIFQLFYDCGYLIPHQSLRKHTKLDGNLCRNRPPGIFQKPIPNLSQKEAFEITLDEYPLAFNFGTFKKPPFVVTGTDENKTIVDYSWDEKGKLQSEADNPYFCGGRLTDGTISAIERFLFGISISY